MRRMAVAQPSSTGRGSWSHHAAVRQGEVRFPATLAILVAGAMHATLPHSLLPEPRWVLPAIEVLLLVPLTLVNTTRLTTETKASRVVSLGLTAVIIATNTLALGYLLHGLLTSHPHDGRELLLAAVQVWVTNMIAFALVFWELDRGGPVARLPASAVAARRSDFLFPQDDQRVADAAMGAPDARWMPLFVDYLYLSITNSVAFSPTDTLPLTTRAKVLMGFEALAAMITSLLVIARAVNILS